VSKPENADAYLAAATEAVRPALHDLRIQLARALPDAEEIMRYGMPGFAIEGTVVAGYAAFSKQCGLYVDPDAIAAHADDLKALKLKPTKTGVTFPPARPIPGALVAAMAVTSRRAKGL
jgi:uncharacterized protein YdhG (YjbR/CyaY superfamily)